MCGTCCCFFFFFQSHGAHRHLHSFPTRRSSDLVLLRSLAERGMRHEDVDVVVLSHLHFDHAGGLLSAFEEGQPPQLLFPKADRKSTRLNSSHLGISYAVFCLKKKKKQKLI